MQHQECCADIKIYLSQKAYFFQARKIMGIKKPSENSRLIVRMINFDKTGISYKPVSKLVSGKIYTTFP
ncbi:hypothetical protein C9994_10560 [Marivirga lumbricoides]|uniref:Uncharacterized protein n=1 Tax=Marivirga lumbricoides TaxID=1046115 RepID=A0A2T4DPH9_9BACT|nr:hypothetical protein C9994_10560 [Marivirga lumbricoides]